MQYAIAFIPEDRRVAIANNIELPSHSSGAVLYADISGFTSLTEAFVQALGPRLGAEAATRQLNRVYEDLIDALHGQGGVVVSFSGDGMLCWFATSTHTSTSAAQSATNAAFCLQMAMRNHGQVIVNQNVTVAMALKTTVTSGMASRFLAGDPAIQRFDVLAGATVDRSAESEQLADQSETLVDGATLAQIESLVHVFSTRTGDSGQRYFVVRPVAGITQSGIVTQVDAAVPQATYDQWLLPSIRSRLSGSQGQYLGDLRPAIALFIRLDNLDFDADPRAVSDLNDHVTWVQSTLDRFGGALIQVTTGDKGGYLYAVFGAPIAHADQETRAAAAAIALQTTRPETAYRSAVQMGLAQGRMRVGPYGSEARRAFGVQGSAVNLAARLMMTARPGQIVVEETLATRLQAQFQTESLGPASIKGFDQPIQIFALGARQRIPVIGHAKSTQSLIGRTEELAILRRAYERVSQTGQGHFVRIEGEAGVGKSRLVAAIVQMLRQEGVLIAVGTGEQVERNTAYLAMRQVMRTLFALDTVEKASAEEASAEEASVEEQIAHVGATLEAYNPDWLLRLPLLGDLLGLHIPDNPTTKAFEPQLRRQALIALTLEILQQMTIVSRLVLLFEDAQWVDEASLDMLQAIARVAHDQPLLLVASHRTAEDRTEETVATLAALPNQSHLLLEPLKTDATATLLAQHLDGPISSLAASLIERQSEGNPFFTEELASALVETNHLLQDESGTWTLSPSIFTTLHRSRGLIRHGEEWQLADDVSLAEAVPGLPDSIHGAVLARFDNLREQEQLTLKTASVIGREFTPELLLSIHPTKVEAVSLQRQITRIAEHDFLRQRDGGVAFKHHITQEIVYRSLLEEQRRDLHQRVGEALERATPDAVDQLAHHFYNASLAEKEVRAKALIYLDDAARMAQRDYANDAALHHLDRALSLESGWQRWLGRAQVLHTLGRRQEEEAALQRLDDIQETPRFNLALAWAELFESTSNYVKAVQWLETALDLARQARDAASEARCMAQLGLIAWRQGDFGTAEARYLSAFVLLNDDSQSYDEEADAHYGLGLVYRQQGRYDDAQSQFEAALDYYRSVEDRQNEAKTFIAIGHVQHYRHALVQAIDSYQTALDLYRSTGDRAGVGTSLLSLAQGMSAQGRQSDSWDLLQEALEIYQATSDLWLETLVWNELGIIAMMTGRLQDAQSALKRSLDMSRALGDDSGIAHTLCNLGQVRRDQGALDEADAFLSQSLRLTLEQGDTHLQATCLLDLALVSLARNNYKQASTRATESMVLFDELNLQENNVTNLTTLALSALHIDDSIAASELVDEALTLLRETQGLGTTFPQREYFICAEVFRAIGANESATDCFRTAYLLLQKQADQISDQNMRRSFRTNLSFNYAILAEAEVRGIT